MGATAIDRVVRENLKGYLKNLGQEAPAGGLYAQVVTIVEKPLFESVLEHTGGNQTLAAKILGINRNTLRKKLQEHKIL